MLHHKYNTRHHLRVIAGINKLHRNRTFSRWGSHFWQLSGLFSHPSSGTFYRCTFSTCFCPWLWISRKTPPCSERRETLIKHSHKHHLQNHIICAGWVFSKFEFNSIEFCIVCPHVTRALVRLDTTGVPICPKLFNGVPFWALCRPVNHFLWDWVTLGKHFFIDPTFRTGSLLCRRRKDPLANRCH